MKVEFLGVDEFSKRQGHRDFALELVFETDFEQSFLRALLKSNYRRGIQCHPKATLLAAEGDKISIMLTREDVPNENSP